MIVKCNVINVACQCIYFIHFCRCISESIAALLALDPSTYPAGNFSQVSYFPVNALASKIPLPSLTAFPMTFHGVGMDIPWNHTLAACANLHF